ncbi:hypothetical protein V1504DRAFT_463425 [Lipomyces starkeyi]
MIFSLHELQDNLLSTAFEQILEPSFSTYVRRSPHIFRRCPTPDCRQICRASMAAKIRTWPKCVAAIRTSGHDSHEVRICAEYKYRASGDYEMDKLKESARFQGLGLVLSFAVLCYCFVLVSELALSFGPVSVFLCTSSFVFRTD